MVNKTIVAVDFDGTLVHNNYPFIGNPNLDLIKFIKGHRMRFTWILWTCRTGKQLEYALDYLKEEHGLRFDYVNENAPWISREYGDSRKVYADIYIDDDQKATESFLRQKGIEMDTLSCEDEKCLGLADNEVVEENEEM